jgi:hypothetical protein
LRIVLARVVLVHIVLVSERHRDRAAGRRDASIEVGGRTPPPSEILREDQHPASVRHIRVNGSEYLSSTSRRAAGNSHTADKPPAVRCN